MAASERLPHIDLLRGAVMVLMVLDHTRDFFQAPGFGPENLSNTTFAWFLVRWVTHFCAPVFVFLAGVSAGLIAEKRSAGELRRFLLTRGLWLMVLEATWVNVSWFFSMDFLHLGVLWAIGGAMVGLAALTLPFRDLTGPPARGAIAGAGALFTIVFAAAGPPEGPAWVRWLVWPAPITVLPVEGWQSYAIVPWMAVMAVGFGAAAWIARARARDQLLVGLALTVAFVALRVVGWGDPGGWEAQERGPWITAVDFLATSKYPPSLQFQLMTLGPAIASLAWWRQLSGAAARILLVFGQVPLFFYLVHLPLVHALGLVHGGLRYGSWVTRGTPIPEGEPLEAWLVIGVWITVVAALWWPCQQWCELKRRRRDVWWLRYL